MYNHNKAQQSKNRVHISCDMLYPHVAQIVALSVDKYSVRIYTSSRK